MSISVRFKSSVPSVFPAEKSETQPHPYRPRIAEAPDRGYSAAEAPEGQAGRSREAPDAGEGRMSCLEHEFTHGRSQS